jgi:IstB-like ATP binding protein
VSGVRFTPRAARRQRATGRGIATELVTSLIEARDERTLLGLRARLAKLDLLVLDELGYVPASKVGAELLFDVISTAYERTSLMVTTNLPFESWTEVLGSERLTGATLDRLTHRCQIIETRGEFYRLRDAKARVKKPGPSGGARPANEATAPPPEAMEGGPRTR